MSHLLRTLASWGEFRAVVVGDFMLDQMVYGHADRLCPDAPVPILHVQRTENRPGGAANVALDLVAMRGRVRVVGVTGDDAEGRQLADELRRAGADPAGLVIDPSRPTTQKRSLIGLAQHRHAQKMFRLDYESREPIGVAVERGLMGAFDAALTRADVVCLEDYGKGVCTPTFCRALIDRARAAGKPVLVDPAAIPDYGKYDGATTLTPNRIEAQRATGVRVDDGAPPEAFAPIAATLIERHGLDAAVITLDRQGALLMERGGGDARVVPTEARQVYDVTGAGDMVLAALAAGRARGLDWYDSVRLANAAAGLEVEVFGVQPIPIERIHSEILGRERSTRGKVRTLDEAVVEAEALRRAGKKIVFTNGCFDVLHVGHASLLRRAAALGDFLVVAVNDDASVRRLKGPTRPVNSEQDRAELVGELGGVGAVVVFAEDTPERVIRAIRPDVLVKGAEYRVDQIPGAAYVIEQGGRVERLDMIDGRSTTRVMERIRRG
ncbi:MAG: D-glycero-beta-D-manno-heptose 1-phosphate adenylyltransferase [Phycisphaerae bacterium]|nr:D-glycero-beta-D-manno-heptose 1-phosphate adenylyltransferase [Phycisphaerae bacterium]